MKTCLSVLIILCAQFWQPLYAEVSQERSERELAQVKSNINKINRWLERANKEKSGLTAALEQQERKIDALSKSIRHSNAKIAVHAKALKKQETALKKQTQALKKQRTFLVKQLQLAYLHGNQSQAKLLLNSDNPQELARDMHFFAYINTARNEKIEEFQTIINEIKDTERKIISEKKQLHDQRTTQKQNQLKLKKEQKSRQKVLAKLQANIKNNAQRLKKMRADQKRLENLLRELENAIVNIPVPDDAAPFYKQKAKLPWPIKGKILARFGSRLAQGKLKLNGISIGSQSNQAVKAVHSGRVIFSNWIRGFGLLIIVDHGNNYMSLYGNNKSLAKETGDWVRAGETLSYVGQSSAKTETGLYFEIRKNGKPLNPSRWLRK